MRLRSPTVERELIDAPAEPAADADNPKCTRKHVTGHPKPAKALVAAEKRATLT
jgi:hypothetical protein